MQPLIFVPQGEDVYSAPCETPAHAFIKRTIAQVSRAFYAILAQNVGIVRETCRAGGKTCHTRGACGCDVQGMLVLRYRSRQVAMAEEELTLHARIL